MNQFLRKYRAVLCAVSVAMAMTSISGIALASAPTSKTEPKMPGKGAENFGVGSTSKEEEIEDKGKKPEYDPFLAMATGQMPAKKTDANKADIGLTRKEEEKEATAVAVTSDKDGKFSDAEPVDAENAKLPIMKTEERINFEWKPADGASKYRYKIFNAKTNKAIKHVSTIQTKGYLPEDKNKEGTYKIVVWAYDKEGKDIGEYQMYFHSGKETEAVKGEINPGNFYFDVAAVAKVTAGKEVPTDAVDQAEKEDDGPKDHGLVK